MWIAAVLVVVSVSAADFDSVGEQHLRDMLALTNPAVIENTLESMGAECTEADVASSLSAPVGVLSQWIYNDFYQWFGVHTGEKQCLVLRQPVSRVLTNYEAAGLMAASQQAFPIPSDQSHPIESASHILPSRTTRSDPGFEIDARDLEQAGNAPMGAVPEVVLPIRP